MSYACQLKGLQKIVILRQDVYVIQTASALTERSKAFTCYEINSTTRLEYNALPA